MDYARATGKVGKDDIRYSKLYQMRYYIPENSKFDYAGSFAGSKRVLYKGRYGWIEQEVPHVSAYLAIRLAFTEWLSGNEFKFGDEIDESEDKRFQGCITYYDEEDTPWIIRKLDNFREKLGTLWNKLKKVKCPENSEITSSAVEKKPKP